MAHGEIWTASELFISWVGTQNLSPTHRFWLLWVICNYFKKPSSVLKLNICVEFWLGRKQTNRMLLTFYGTWCLKSQAHWVMAPVWYRDLDIFFNKHLECLLWAGTVLDAFQSWATHWIWVTLIKERGVPAPSTGSPAILGWRIMTTLWGGLEAQSGEVVSGGTFGFRFHALSHCQRGRLLSWEAPENQTPRATTGKPHMDIHQNLQMWTSVCPATPAYGRCPVNACSVL